MDGLIFRADRRHEPLLLLLPRHALTLQNKTATLNKTDESGRKLAVYRSTAIIRMLIVTDDFSIICHITPHQFSRLQAPKYCFNSEKSGGKSQQSGRKWQTGKNVPPLHLFSRNCAYWQFTSIQTIPISIVAGVYLCLISLRSRSIFNIMWESDLFFT